MPDDKREPTEEELQDWRAAHDRMLAELAAIKTRILAEPARMAALGVKDENELRQLPVGVMFAYGHGAGIPAPAIWPWRGEA